MNHINFNYKNLLKCGARSLQETLNEALTKYNTEVQISLSKTLLAQEKNVELLNKGNLLRKSELEQILQMKKPESQFNEVFVGISTHPSLDSSNIKPNVFKKEKQRDSEGRGRNLVF